jgi:hypothetical protein
MFFYEKGFWRDFQSERIKVLEKEYQSSTSREQLITEYLAGQENDINRYLWWYEQFASTSLAGVTPACPIQYAISDSQLLEAKIDFSSNFRNTNVYLSRGLCFSIFDLMNRICCNKAILSYSTDFKTMVWPGSECFWPESHIMPEIRFSNYQPVENPAFGQHTGSTISSAFGLFHCGIPIGDEDRLYTASLMEFLSLTWVLFHEESHYWHGHIHYLDSHEVNVLSETDSFTGDSLLLKTFEWQADRNATLDLMNMFFVDRQDAPFELPAYFSSGEQLGWYIRIIVCALGATVLIFQKMKIINNKTDYYPTPECRMSTILGIIYSRLMSIVEQRGNILGITDPTEARNTITDALVAGLYDLLGIEEVFANDVDYEGNIQRVVYEKVNPASLRFIEDISNIPKIIKGLVNRLQSDDEQINKKWFNEYKRLIESHDHVFNHILPTYRMEAAGGKDPLGQPLVEKSKKSQKVCILLVRGENYSGTPFFAYVAVLEDNVEAFMIAQSMENFYPEDYGVIIESGEGEPSEEIRNKIKDEYGVELD